MAKSNAKSVEGQQPDTDENQESSGESSAFGNGSSLDADLRLSDDAEMDERSSDDSSTFTDLSGNSFETSDLTTDSTDLITDNSPELQTAPEELEPALKDIFTAVERAVQQNADLPQKIKQFLEKLDFKLIHGSDTRAPADDGSSREEAFTGFTLRKPPAEEIMTKMYENGGIVTKVDNGLEVRIPPHADFAEISENSQDPQRIPRSEANIPIASEETSDYTLTQKADGTALVEYKTPQEDGADSMTLYPPNPKGLKWTRNIPESVGVPAHTITARTDGSKIADFSEPMGSVVRAKSLESGEILASRR